MAENKPFEKFQFRVKWMEFAATLQPKEETAFKWAVILYGLKSEEPTRLHGKSLEYFNSEVRPDIDKQHKRMRNKRGL